MEEDTFLRCANEICHLSNKIHDGWMMKNLSGITFLNKKIPIVFHDTQVDCEYQIVYDSLYGAPKLYFNMFKSDGHLLNFEECSEILQYQRQDALETFSQMDHPALQVPFYCLHPCKTLQFLGDHSNSKNVLVTWLSSVGVRVGLYLENTYAQLT